MYRACDGGTRFADRQIAGCPTTTTVVGPTTTTVAPTTSTTVVPGYDLALIKIVWVLGPFVVVMRFRSRCW